MRNKMLLTLAARLEEARREDGQGMVEYALILSLVALVAAVGYTALGGNVDTLVSGITF